MMRGRIARLTLAAGLLLAMGVTARTVESADFGPRRPSPRVVQARYRTQAQPIESAESMPQNGEVIYEGMSPDEIEMYGEPMPGQYAETPEGSFPYPKLYNVRPHRSHGAIAPQSRYYGYYPTCWRRWPEGWVGPKYQDGPAEEIPTGPTPAEQLPDPNMPAPGALPQQMPAEDEYGPTPGGQPAPGGMTRDAPTMLPDDQLPEQPMPLGDAPPLFPTDELDAPGLPSDDAAPGLPTDDMPLGPPSSVRPSDALPRGGLPRDDTPQELPALTPPPGLPTDTPPPGLPTDNELPAPADPFGEPALDELPAPGTLDTPPPADDSDDAPRPGFSLHDDAPPRFIPQQAGPSQDGPQRASSQRANSQRGGPQLGGRQYGGPRLTPAQTSPAPAVPHTASVAGHRGPAVNEFQSSEFQSRRFQNRELRGREINNSESTEREYRNNQSVDDNQWVDEAPLSQPNDQSGDGPSLWPAPSQSPVSVSPTEGDERPEGLNALPEGAHEAAPVDSFDDSALPPFPQSAMPKQRATRWQTTPSGEMLRSQAASPSIDRAVRPAANWTSEGSDAAVAANQPLAIEPAVDGANPLRGRVQAGSTTPPRRLPANMRANPLR